jgi:hypothetical protein
MTSVLSIGPIYLASVIAFPYPENERALFF